MLLKRPEFVVFDPSIKEHRQAVRAFMKRKAWSDSPLKFTHDPKFGSVADQVQSKLLYWYAEQEDARESKRAIKKLIPESITSMHELKERLRRVV